MRKISLWLFILVFTASLARAQDATQQQIDQINGKLQDLQESVDAQTKKIAALEKQISDLGGKLNQPAASDSASADDLKKLAAQVQEIDKKRQDDNEHISQTLEKLGKLVAGGSTASHKPKATTETLATGGDNSTPPSSGPKNGYYYPIKDGDTLSAVAKAYRDSDKHVKVTTKDILNANPGLDATKLYVGQKIFIPDPNAK